MYNDTSIETWKQRYADGDTSFNDENIAATEEILTKFLKNLSKNSGSQEEILKIVKEVVLSLNRIGGFDGTLGNFIKTEEREELCDFINHAARVSGLEEDDSLDITEEWREW
ncbi:hypothetical protein [Leptospira weilii]|uniref:hypothetical protein n=1 Tax=Leptospira weilii TaxID=28184 RepID=UPI00031A7993|nr:hypothetical protein [Leptospira weilii]